MLRAGLAVSCALFLAGLAMSLARGDDHTRPVRLFALFARGDRADALMGAGVLVLAMTPALRVVLLLYLWSRERDWRFVRVAAMVVVTLGLAMMLGKG